jgi:hypothetical protein
MGYLQAGAIVANGRRIFSRWSYSMPPLRRQGYRHGVGQKSSTAGAALDGEGKMFQMRSTTRLVAPGPRLRTPVMAPKPEIDCIAQQAVNNGPSDYERLQ